MSDRTVSGWTRRVVLAVMASGALLLPSPAHAADCTGSLVTCATGTVEDTTDAVSGAEDGAPDTVGDVVDTASDTVDSAGGAVGDVVRGAGDTAGGTIDEVGRIIDSVGGPDPGSPGGSTGGPGTRGSDGPLDPTTRPITPATIRRLRSASPGSSVTVVGPSPESLIASELIRRDPTALLGSSVGQVAIEVAKRLAFPLALLVLALAFVAVQHRIDRRAPKLALASVEPDVVPFS